MSTLKTAPEITWNGANINAGMSEQALDNVIEDSFPASDPPSHTPLTSLGPPKAAVAEAPPGHWWSRTLVAVGAAILAVAVATGLVATALWRRKAAH